MTCPIPHVNNLTEKLTVKTAKVYLKAIGYSINKRPYSEEYRVAPTDASLSPKVKEDRAYYTNDLHDAYGTARHEYCREHGVENVAS